MKNKIALFLLGFVLLAMAACSNRKLCPAYSAVEPAVVEIPESDT